MNWSLYDGGAASARRGAAREQQHAKRTEARRVASEIVLNVREARLRLDQIPHRGQHWGMASNGDYVVAIVRNGQLVTAYLRRGTQSFCPSVTRTRVLVDMTGNLLRKPIFS